MIAQEQTGNKTEATRCYALLGAVDAQVADEIRAIGRPLKFYGIRLNLQWDQLSRHFTKLQHQGPLVAGLSTAFETVAVIVSRSLVCVENNRW